MPYVIHRATHKAVSEGDTAPNKAKPKRLMKFIDDTDDETLGSASEILIEDVLNQVGHFFLFFFLSNCCFFLIVLSFFLSIYFYRNQG